MNGKPFLLFFFLIVASSWLSAPAFARSSGDLFADASWNAWTRPPVPSDYVRRHTDFLKPVPVFFNKNAELFDGLKLTKVAVRDDMLAVTPKPYPISPIFRPWKAK